MAELNLKQHTRLEVMGITEYQDRDGNKQSWWTKIGSAFWNKDGSLNVKFDYFPRDPGASIQIRPPREKPVVTGKGGDGKTPVF